MGIAKHNFPPSLLFRVDGEASVALGHLRRCVAVANKVEQKGGRVWFFGHFDDSGSRLLSSNGFDRVCTNTYPSDSSSVRELIEVAERRDAQRVIVDSYRVDQLFFKQLRIAGVEVTYFEDHGNVTWTVDEIVNGRVDAEQIPYSAKQLMTGSKYAILPPEFENMPRKRVSGAVKRILVTLGGVDHYDLSSRILSTLNQVEGAKGLELDLVIGPYFSNRSEINNAIKEVTETLCVNVHSGLNSLAPLMLECDLAISAGGITLNELAAAGVPCVGIALWPNQLPNVVALGDRGILLPIDYQKIGNFSQELIRCVVDLLNRHELRSDMSQKGQRLIDGKGASRVAAALIEPLRY
jgi:UDP-2,4-diacetamido-2,4,6-trideoxy-beta-L-altropyranose hydrolase